MALICVCVLDAELAVWNDYEHYSVIVYRIAIELSLCCRTPFVECLIRMF